MRPQFEWDALKEAVNIAKHGVDFETAERAFWDPLRKIYKDEKHSISEERFFCFGRVEKQVLTVRFTYRENVIRIIGAGFWREGEKIYEKENA